MRISKDPETRRQEIIDTAWTLFELRGIGKTSMAEIADQLGVAKGLVYYYFSSKEQLAEVVIGQFIAGLDHSLGAVLDRQELEFPDKMAAILKIYFDVIRTHPSLLSCKTSNPEIFALIRDRLSDIALSHARILLQHGIAKNLIQIDYPDYMLMILIRGLGDLYIEGVHDPLIHATLIEQTLGLGKGRLSLGLADKPLK